MRKLNLLTIAALAIPLFSCETVPPRKAGGAAFDESYIGQRLDSNQADLEGNLDYSGRKTAPPSFDQWRGEED